MTITVRKIPSALAVLLLGTLLAGQEKPFSCNLHRGRTNHRPGNPVQLDEHGKLLPWPMPDNVGYSYSSHVLTQWTILWDQLQPAAACNYFYCCFDFDRTTFELRPGSALGELDSVTCAA